MKAALSCGLQAYTAFFRFKAAYERWSEAGLQCDFLGWKDSHLLDGVLLALLGYEHLEDILVANPADYKTTVDALCGEHGYAVFRMLLVKRGMT